MKFKKLGITALAISLILSGTGATFADGEPNTEIENDSVQIEEPIEASNSVETVVETPVEKSVPLNTRTPKLAGQTIKEIFPDPIFASAVAQNLGVSVDTVLTQPMIDSLITLRIVSSDVTDASGIEHLTALKSLYFSNNLKLNGIPEGIGALTKLEILDLGSDKLTSLPESIGNLTNLKQLILPNNQLTSLPESLGQLTNLERLYLSGNNLTTLPDSMGSLANLKILNLTSNQLTELPSSFGNLTNLTSLNLDKNQLTCLPDNFGQLVNLPTLDLSENQLASLPESIGDLKVIKLNLNRNQLTTLPDGLTNLVSLKELYLNYNQLTSLPENIGNLLDLEQIDLSSNELMSIPESFWNLTKLKTLHLSNNKLTRLSDGVGNLTNMWALYLGNNQLTSLPDGLVNCTGLKHLDVYLNLLPTVYYSGFKWATVYRSGFSHTGQTQSRIEIKANAEKTYLIKKETDLTEINLFSLLDVLVSNVPTPLFPNHTLELENYKDSEGNTVSLDTYLKNGIVQKTGTVYAQVRAAGTGFYPNALNGNTLTHETLTLNFEITEYPLTFDLNGGPGVVPTSQALIEGAKAMAVDDPIRPGYTFKGWNTAQNGSGATWDFTMNTMPAGGTTLFAQWKANQYTLTFDYGDATGGNMITTKEVTYDAPVGTLPEPTREGYAFKGWVVMPDMMSAFIISAAEAQTEVLFTEDTIYTFVGNQTLSAQWEKQAEPVTPTTPENSVNPVAVATGGTKAPATGDVNHNPLYFLLGLMAISGLILMKKRTSRI